MTAAVRLLLALLVVTLAACIQYQTVPTTQPAPTPRAAVTYVATMGGDDTTGAVCTDGTPCSVRRGLIKLNCANSDVLELLGTTASPTIYQGDVAMLNLYAHVPGKSGSSGGRCTVRARNDGGVFIDGQMTRRTFVVEGHSYWTFQGFDVGNSGGATDGYVVWVNSGGGTSTGLIFQRIVASNASTVGTNNLHIWAVGNCTSCVLEDIGAFGTGRNDIVEGGNVSTIFRRAWVRWDGWNGTGGPIEPIQNNYGASNATWENIITVWGANQHGGISDPGSGSNKNGSMLQRDATTGTMQYRGFIGYGTGSVPFALDLGWFHIGQPATNTSLVDIYIDDRSQNSPNGPFCFTTVNGGTADRLTGIRSTNASCGFWTATTNQTECTTPGNCPNFYTGVGQGTSAGAVGARNCQEYQDGALTTTADRRLWPWRMDDRIKGAITRAGGAALGGSAGAGYAAGTVTSEIVLRYGAIPTTCQRSAGTTPNPPAGLNLTGLWRAIWTPLAGIRS